MFVWSAVVFALLIAVLVVACIGRDVSLAGCVLAPAFVAGAQVLLLWGRVP